MWGSKHIDELNEFCEEFVEFIDGGGGAGVKVNRDRIVVGAIAWQLTPLSVYPAIHVPFPVIY